MNLNIVYVNDVHGYVAPHNELFYSGKDLHTEVVGGYSRIATLVDRVRDGGEPTLLFDGGDTFHGTLPLVRSKGEAILPILNKLAFDAMVGHWDFGYGPDQLKHLLSELRYPMLGINVYNTDGSLFLKPFIILQVEDLRIGVVGLCSDIIDKTMPERFSKGLRVTNGMQELPAYVDQLRKDAVDLIIVLSHNGFPQDMHMLHQVDGIDVCLSAHTHNRLYSTAVVNGARLIQCGCHGSFLGHLKLHIENKRIIGHTYDLLKVDHYIEPDPVIEQMVQGMLDPYKEMKANVIGRTGTILHRYDTLNSSMDELLLRAVMHASGTQIAFSNGWRYGAPIAAGAITEEDLYNMVPMDPPVSTVELTGQEIMDMLEENMERTWSRDPMEQMGGYVKRCKGLRINLRIENPKGHRIQEVYFGDAHIQPQKVYHVGFVTSQGVPKHLGANRKDLEITAVAAMKNFLGSCPEFNPDDSGCFALV